MGHRLNLPVHTSSAVHLSFFPFSLLQHICLSLTVPVTQQGAIIGSQDPNYFCLCLETQPVPILTCPYHLLGSQKGQLLPQTGDTVVASPFDGCAAGDSLCVQILHHAGLRGGLATWRPGPRGLQVHSGGAWMPCLCNCPSGR